MAFNQKYVKHFSLLIPQVQKKPLKYLELKEGQMLMSFVVLAIGHFTPPFLIPAYLDGVLQERVGVGHEPE